MKLKEYRYTGKERDDATGLYYYGARYYACWVGRWLSCDPLYRNNPSVKGNDIEGRFLAYGQSGGDDREIVDNIPYKFKSKEQAQKTGFSCCGTSNYVRLSSRENADRAKENNSSAAVREVFTSINLNTYHYSKNNPIKYFDPDGNQSVSGFDIMKGFWNYDLSSFKIRIFDEIGAAGYSLKEQAKAYSAGYSSGIVAGLVGIDLDLFDPEYVEPYQSNIDYYNLGKKHGELVGQALIYTNIGRTLGQEVGKEAFRKVLTDILTDPVRRKKFMKGFAQGLVPAVTKSQLSSLEEKLGYALASYFTYVTANEINKNKKEINKNDKKVKYEK